MVFLHDHRPKGVCSNTNFPVAVPILSFPQFVTIIDRTNLYYYLFDGEVVAHQGELAQMVESSLGMREVLGSIPRSSSY